MVAKFKGNCSKNSTIVPYKINIGSDGNLMPYHAFKIYSLGQQQSNFTLKEQSIF